MTYPCAYNPDHGPMQAIVLPTHEPVSACAACGLAAERAGVRVDWLSHRARRHAVKTLD